MAAPRSVLETKLEGDKSKLLWSPVKKALVGALGALLAVVGMVLIIDGNLDDDYDWLTGDDTEYRDREPTTPTSKCMPGHEPCGSRCCLSGWSCCGDGRCAPGGWC